MQCEIPKYELVVFPNDFNTFGYIIYTGFGTGIMRQSVGFSDEESARQFGQRAMYCLNMDFSQTGR